ncbi:EF hand domain-containing protein [Spironucleus salmonicida]|uniref:EF hand domain-containing protein n=1 Tax=Spironucleus salmonicida TaxID=348837 RepID=V6LRJ3_9EUKA|nr:EF hand domain-containing protein [Spironucleus salmonicida]|eukprot:EST47277.1 Hypothetical protein SS50377_12787 [Spironucleus salmonicida]
MSQIKQNLQLYESIFRKIDADNSGFIDVPELQVALVELGVQMDQKTISGMIELVDDNADGQMQLEEFVHFLYICENARPDDVPTILFLAADEDYSQTIDSDELMAIILKLGIEITKEEIKEIMDSIADNDDGTISYEMFCALMEEILNE